MMNDRLSVRRNERWRLLLPTGVRRPDSRSFPFPDSSARPSAPTPVSTSSPAADWLGTLFHRFHFDKRLGERLADGGENLCCPEIVIPAVGHTRI